MSGSALAPSAPAPAGARVAMVSGGTRGIGLAIVRELAAAGWQISVGARSAAEPPSGAFLPGVLWQAYDATDPASEVRWVQATLARFGRIDALVHNAGILSDRSVLQATGEEFDRVFEVNVKSPMRLTQQAWPALSSAEGKVVVMASLAAKRVRAPEGTLYGMSKAAALSLAHALRHCGAEARVRCTAICPGFTDTDMATHVPTEQRARLTRPEDLARIVRLVLELPASASVAEIPVSWCVEPSY